MVQKQFRYISNWEEFKELWDKNDTVEVAIGLLHASPTVVLKNLSKGLGLCDEPGHKAVRFYLQTARLLDGNPRLREVGRKAYQILVGILDKHWDRLLPDEKLVQEIVDFFAESKDRRFFNEQPYREAVEAIVKNIWRLVKAGRCNWLSQSPSQTKRINVSRAQLVQALLNAELFDFILEQEIIEAIPFLQERLAPVIKWKIEVTNLRLQQEFSFPSFDQARITEMLNNPQSWVMKFALRDDQTREETRTLLELMFKRDIQVPYGVAR